MLFADFFTLEVLPETAHEGGCFGKGEILLMLYLHERLDYFEEVILLRCSGSLGRLSLQLKKELPL